MYNGIKRKRNTDYKIYYETKVQQISLEEIEHNGIISQQYKVKTIDYKADKNISFRDFEINNLKAAGINVDTMQEVKLPTNVEKAQKNAEQANIIMDRIDLFNEIAKQQNNGEQQQQPKQEETV